MWLPDPMTATLVDTQLVYRSDDSEHYDHAWVLIWAIDDGYVGEVHAYDSHGYGPWQPTRWLAGHTAWLCWDELSE